MERKEEEEEKKTGEEVEEGGRGVPLAAVDQNGSSSSS